MGEGMGEGMDEGSSEDWRLGKVLKCQSAGGGRAEMEFGTKWFWPNKEKAVDKWRRVKGRGTRPI